MNSSFLKYHKKNNVPEAATRARAGTMPPFMAPTCPRAINGAQLDPTKKDFILYQPKNPVTHHVDAAQSKGSPRIC